MTPTLFDPRSPPPGIWPATRILERAFIQGVAAAGVRTMVGNVVTRWRALRSGDRLFPVTINDGEIGGSYVCLPHSAYALYARQELDLVDIGRARLLARPILALLGRLLLAARINRVVHIDNWLLSTNLHGDWRGDDLAAIRRCICDRFPDHLVAIRSLDDWSCPELLAAARADGWTLVPSRQIWVTDDLATDWVPRNAYGNDRRMVRRSGLEIATIDEMTGPDADAIAELYHLLYVGKYSALNPTFTPAFVTMTHSAGMIRYRVARAADGSIRAVAGSTVRGDILTPPVVGYDTTAPRRDGLYRLASFLFAQEALANGLRLHGSAGAPGFKRLRGAHGVIEYSAMYTRHLSPARRRAIDGFAAALDRFIVPMMRRRGL